MELKTEGEVLTAKYHAFLIDDITIETEGYWTFKEPKSLDGVTEETVAGWIDDPRAGKVQIDLPEQDMGMATPASKMINFTPKTGMMIFANSWLSHSFTRHAAEKPIKFVHFNLTVIPQPQTCAVPQAVEII